MQELCLALQSGASGMSASDALRQLPLGTTCTTCGRAVQACSAGFSEGTSPCLACCLWYRCRHATPLLSWLQTESFPRLACAVRVLLVQQPFFDMCLMHQGAGPRQCRACGAAARATLKRNSMGNDFIGRSSAGKGSKSGGSVSKSTGAKARVHMAQPTARGIPRGRSERGSHRHKRLFTSEPGALQVGLGCLACPDPAHEQQGHSAVQVLQLPCLCDLLVQLLCILLPCSMGSQCSTGLQLGRCC